MAKNKFHDGPGPSQRQLRVGELIRRTLSEVLARGLIHDPELNRISGKFFVPRFSGSLPRFSGRLPRFSGKKNLTKIMFLW